MQLVIDMRKLPKMKFMIVKTVNLRELPVNAIINPLLKMVSAGAEYAGRLLPG